MKVYYEQTDITDVVQVRECTVHDTAGRRCDSMNIEFENAAVWDRWSPQEDDRIAVTESAYDSGIMYVNTVQEENGRYRIYATSLPCKARNRGYFAYKEKTLEDILRHCAAVSGMDFGAYGLDLSLVIPYIERDNEGCAAFLSRLLALEGAVLKCINGKYAAIGLEYAQSIPVRSTAEVTAKQKGLQYHRSGMTLKKLTVASPYASATAEDTAVDSSHVTLTKSCLPVMDNVQAGRWARGLLLHHNRECEQIYMTQKFNAGLTAMTRMDILSSTAANGAWIVEDVEHDLKNLKTSALLRPCITTIR